MGINDFNCNVGSKTMNSSHGLRFLFTSIGLTALLYVVPFGEYVAYPLILLSTLAHEMGHGIAAILVGGEFHKFCLYSDASGVAYTSHDGGIASAVVSAGGLVGPAIVGSILFASAHRAKWLFLVIGIGLLLAEFLVVRNGFGLVFVGIVSGLSLYIASLKNRGVQQISAYFLAIQMTMSVFSRGDYLFTPTAKTAQGVMPSDVAHIADALVLPYWFWGAICGLFSIVCLVVGIRAAIQTIQRPSSL